MQEEDLMIKEAEGSFWVFTTHCLKPFKGYFSSREEALNKVISLIKSSNPWYKKCLEREASEEIYLNELNKDDSKYKASYRAQRRNEDWNEFSESELESSIKVVDLSLLNKKNREKIFFDRIR